MGIISNKSREGSCIDLSRKNFWVGFARTRNLFVGYRLIRSKSAAAISCVARILPASCSCSALTKPSRVTHLSHSLQPSFANDICRFLHSHLLIVNPQVMLVVARKLFHIAFDDFSGGRSKHVLDDSGSLTDSS